MKSVIMLLLLFFSIEIFAESENHDFQIARVHYDGGGDWYSDPSSLPNLLQGLKDRFGLNVPKKEAVIKLDDQGLFRYPFIYITGHGNISFNPLQIEALRRYFQQGGFLWADDNYGMDKSFRREIKKLYPQSEMVELPFSHPIYNSYYKFTEGLPKIHEHDGGAPHGYGLFVDGRMVIFYSFNTDIGDGLESADIHNDPPEAREKAMRMALNIVLYSLNN